MWIESKRTVGHPSFVSSSQLVEVEDAARTRRNYFCCKGTSLSDLAPASASATWWETSKHVLSRPRPSGIENDFEGTYEREQWRHRDTTTWLSFPFQSEPAGKNSLSEEIFSSWLSVLLSSGAAVGAFDTTKLLPSRSFIKISRMPNYSNANWPLRWFLLRLAFAQTCRFTTINHFLSGGRDKSK